MAYTVCWLAGTLWQRMAVPGPPARALPVQAVCVCARVCVRPVCYWCVLPVCAAGACCLWVVPVQAMRMHKLLVRAS